ncbi:hypothetical protein ACHAWF_007189, partial [Thalassiosira exigua]
MVIAYTLPYIAGSCQEPLPWTGETTLQEHWEKTILNKYDDLHDKPPGLGPIQWRLAVALFVFWIITYVSIAFGKNILAQVTYVTVILPVVLMLVLVIVTVQQPGAAEGIKFYIGKFEASELAKLDVWATALGQILFSLSPGFGTAITYSSFAARNEDVYRVGFIVAIANSAFSLIGGIAVFSIVGYLAEKEGLTVEEVATRGGQGLAFITIASAMPFFGAAQNVMSVLFYVMLLTLGLDSSYAWTETIVSSVDEVLHARGIKRPFWQVSLVLCTVMFLLGLVGVVCAVYWSFASSLHRALICIFLSPTQVFTTRMGGQILDVIDMFVGTIFLLAACFIESIIFNIDLDWRRVSLALKAATKGNRRFPDGRNLFPRFLCRIDYHLTVPLATGLLFIYIFVDVASKPYGDYPTSLLAWGWTLLSLLLATSLLTVWKRDPSKLPAIEDDPKLQPVLNPDSVAFKGEDSSANELELAEGENPADAGFQEEPAQEAISQEAPSQEAPSQEAPSQEGLAGDSTKEDGSS